MTLYTHTITNEHNMVSIDNVINAMNEDEHEQDTEVINSLKTDETPEKLCTFKNLLDILTEEAKIVIDLIFNAPKELAKEDITKNTLNYYLNEHTNWSEGLKRCIFREIQHTINYELNEAQIEQKEIIRCRKPTFKQDLEIIKSRKPIIKRGNKIA